MVPLAFGAGRSGAGGLLFSAAALFCARCAATSGESGTAAARAAHRFSAGGDGSGGDEPPASWAMICGGPSALVPRTDATAAAARARRTLHWKQCGCPIGAQHSQRVDPAKLGLLGLGLL